MEKNYVSLRTHYTYWCSTQQVLNEHIKYLRYLQPTTLTNKMSPNDFLMMQNLQSTNPLAFVVSQIHRASGNRSLHKHQETETFEANAALIGVGGTAGERASSRHMACLSESLRTRVYVLKKPSEALISFWVFRFCKAHQ